MSRQPLVKPMSIGGAAGWIFAITAAFLLLWGVVLSARASAENDELTGFACQAIAYLLGLFAILRFYGPDASIRDFVGLRKTSWLFFPIAILLGVAATFAADALYNLISHRWPIEDGPSLTKTLSEASTARKI